MCWDTGTPLSTDVRGLGLWWAQGSWWALLLCSQLFGQNVRTPQEAIQPVRHFQGGQDCRCCVVKGMMFVYIYFWVPVPLSRRSVCSLLCSCPSGWCSGEGQVKELLPFSMEVVLSLINPYHIIIISLSLQLNNHSLGELLGHLPCPLPLNSPWFEIPGGLFVWGEKGFHFQCLLFDIEWHMFPKRCILPKKGMVDPPLPLFFVCVRRVAVSLVVWVWFCLRMGWSKNQEWLLANCPSVFLL